MPAKKGAFTLILGEPWNAMLEDFCAAFYRAEKTEVIRRALEAYIPARIAKADADEERSRYEQLQAARPPNERFPKA